MNIYTAVMQTKRDPRLLALQQHNYNRITVLVSGRFEGTVTTAVGILGAVAPHQFKSTWNVAEWILYILFPTYCFNAVLQNIYKNYNGHKVCSELSHGLTLADMCASEKGMYNSNPCCPGKHFLRRI